MENHLRLFLLLRLFLQYLRCLIRSSGILLAETQNLIANDNQVTVFQKRRHRQRIAVEFRPVGAAQIFDTPFPCGIQADRRVLTRNAADKKLDIIVRLPADTDSGRRNLFRFTGPGTIQKIKFHHISILFFTPDRALRFPPEQSTAELFFRSGIHHRRQIHDITACTARPFYCTGR